MKKTWWKESVVYQVYWRSFLDTNGDGIGDLRGVINKLDYIKELGVDVIWVNPFYMSPDKDNGYDISDYYSVMPKAGNMDDFKELLSEAHKRNLKIIMDLVVNHTSNQHPWFLESRSGKSNPKRDWYIWKDGKNGSEPNNWRSYFCPSTWEYDEETEQYYFHSFAVEQPDLNWENEELRKEIYKMMRFWLDLGIDGFRLDAIALLAKQEGYSDAENPHDISYLTNNPKVHDYIKEMNKEVFSHYDILTVGEVAFAGPSDGLKYVGEDRQELNTLFHFEVCDEMPTWDLQRFIEIQNRWYEGLWGKGWNSQFLNNHDHTRLVTRYGNDKEYRIQSAKLFATMLHSLPGTPYIYQGEEIGMTGVTFDSIDDYNDIAMKNKYYELVSSGMSPKDALKETQPLSRDNSRTPMQWDDSINAGFTLGHPWIKINPNYKAINVQNELADNDSIFNFYKKLIQLRKHNKTLVYGTYKHIPSSSDDVYIYERNFEDTTLLTVLNFNTEEVTVELPYLPKNVLIHNYAETKISGKKITLKPYESFIANK